MNRAVSVTADGAVFQGASVDADGMVTGEAVLNTSITGYQEIITDPAYSRKSSIIEPKSWLAWHTEP